MSHGPRIAVNSASRGHLPTEHSVKTLSVKTLDALVKRYPSVQLATLVEEPPPGDEWVHEVKLDGYRLLGFVAGDEVCLRTRNGQDWTHKFPAIAAAMQGLKAGDAVIDMEAVVLDDKGKSNFQALQAALGDDGNRQRIAAFVFDILDLDGEDLTRLPLLRRKQALQRLLQKSKPGKVLAYSDHIVGHGAEMFAKACSMGLEGIICKRADSTYQIGRERTWLKVKCGQRQEFIILGYSDARKGNRALGALYLGYHANGELKYAGKVGTGFSLKSARELVERFSELAIEKPVLPRNAMTDVTAAEWSSVHWIKPKLLCEVAFTEWTQDGHIRHPSFQGLREDKGAAEVKMEKPAAKKNGSGLELAGVAITHPDRVISEIGHITKGELAEYYAAVAPFMMPEIVRRPLSLLRCPSGIDGQCFYQRNPGKGLGPDVHPFKFRHKGKTYEYLYIEDEKGLLGLIQMGSIEIHPWGATIDAIDDPDRMIFDLDPAPDVPFDAVKLAAQDLRQRLRSRGLESSLKCTGGKGLHVTVALAGKNKWDEVKTFASEVAHEMVESAPDAYIATMAKAKRTGKIFVDYFRNDYTATAIADYAVRARTGAPVAVPLEWSELKNLKSADQFTIRDALKRIEKKRPSAQPAGQELPQS